MAAAACGNTGKNVPYTVMDNYFVNNDVAEAPCGAVRTQEEFDKLFGEAAVMGKDGEPTPVDFAKEFVIAVATEPTDVATTLEPVSLVKASDGNLVFTWKKISGGKMTYTIQPCLLVKVSNTNSGEVTIKEEK